jgi:D-lactate dehydrogenase
MRVAVFNTQSHDRTFLSAANDDGNHELVFFEPRLTEATLPLADGFAAVCVFVNDTLSRPVVETLARRGTRLIALRAAGFNNIDLDAAHDAGLTVVRVPAYSPHAVAEHTIALILTLNRKVHRAYQRVREGNFSLEGLLGFDLAGRRAGIVGTGNIGAIVARILHGFGCHLLAHDPVPNPVCERLGVHYVSLPELLRASDIVTLHCPLTPDTYHMIDHSALALMKRGAMLVNTGRGGLIDTRSVIAALKSGRLGFLGLDVYEEEEDLFFADRSHDVIRDDVFARLLTFPNVVITGHQGFFTEEALRAIAETTLANISAFEEGGPLPNAVSTGRELTGRQAD